MKAIPSNRIISIRIPIAAREEWAWQADQALAADQLYGTHRSHSPLDTNWEGTITDRGTGELKGFCKLAQDMTKAVLRLAPSWHTIKGTFLLTNELALDRICSIYVLST